MPEEFIMCSTGLHLRYIRLEKYCNAIKIENLAPSGLIFSRRKRRKACLYVCGFVEES